VVFAKNDVKELAPLSNQSDVNFLRTGKKVPPSPVAR
jgi:hypothetical protein